jgi:hypothetical protein
MVRPPNKTQSRLEGAIATLTQAQASMVQTHEMCVRDTREYKRIATETFGRIESILLENSRILADHSRILHALPEAICDKIGLLIREKPSQ